MWKDFNVCFHLNSGKFSGLQNDLTSKFYQHQFLETKEKIMRKPKLCVSNNSGNWKKLGENKK